MTSTGSSGASARLEHGRTHRDPTACSTALTLDGDDLVRRRWTALDHDDTLAGRQRQSSRAGGRTARRRNASETQRRPWQRPRAALAHAAARSAARLLSARTVRANAARSLSATRASGRRPGDSAESQTRDDAGRRDQLARREIRAAASAASKKRGHACTTRIQRTRLRGRAGEERCANLAKNAPCELIRQAADPAQSQTQPSGRTSQQAHVPVHVDVVDRIDV